MNPLIINRHLREVSIASQENWGTSFRPVLPQPTEPIDQWMVENEEWLVKLDSLSPEHEPDSSYR